MQETDIRDLGLIPGWEDYLEEEMAARFSILAWRIPWTEEPGRLQSIGLQRVRHYWSSLAFLCLHKIENTADSDYVRVWEPLFWSRPSRTNSPKRCPFHYRGLEFKSRKSRNTWGDRQIWPWNTEWSRAKTNRILPREHTGHSEHHLPTTPEKTTHGHHQMVNTEIRLIIFFAVKDGETLYSQQKQDWELTVAQIMNPLLPNSDLNWRK